jgi:hypothetical protein
MNRVSSSPAPKMSNRRHILDLISCVMRKIKNAGGYEQRFTLLDNVQILTDILKEVTTFETKLLMELDVD